VCVCVCVCLCVYVCMYVYVCLHVNGVGIEPSLALRPLTDLWREGIVSVMLLLVWK
jgi:hypothetical protein